MVQFHDIITRDKASTAPTINDKMQFPQLLGTEDLVIEPLLVLMQRTYFTPLINIHFLQAKHAAFYFIIVPPNFLQHNL